MNLDDFIIGEDALQLMVNLLSEEGKWLISGCIHYDYGNGTYA